jgi:arginyl-tRNA synthetase
MIKENLEKIIEKSFEDLFGKECRCSLEKPAESSFGDFATSLALSESKNLGKSPRLIAESLVENLREQNLSFVKSFSIAGPGFINITLTEKAIRKEIAELIQKKFVETSFTGKKVLVEHSSPNLFKPFHIGHLMNNIVGSFVASGVRMGGGDVVELSYPSDISLGIAKAIYIIADVDKKSPQDIFEMTDEKEAVAYFGECYRRGVAFYDEAGEEAQRKIKDIANILYAHSGAHNETDSRNPYWNIYQNAKDSNLSYFKDICNYLGSTFDGFIFESEAGIRGKAVVEAYTEGEEKVFTKSEGAIVYIPDEERKDINTMVFINSEGNPTYAAKDIGLIDIKFSRYSPAASFTITDNEQATHFKTVFDAYAKIEKFQKEKGMVAWEAGSKNINVNHGRMTFKGNKMSSRLGGVPLAEDIINAIQEEVKERSSEKIAKFSPEEKDEIQKNIALSALKFTILKSKLGSNSDFDPERALSFEGDSGPYVLYTLARIHSLLEKAAMVSLTPMVKEGVEISSLEKEIFHAENVWKKGIEELAPQAVITFLFKISQEFNSYYAAHTIIDETSPEMSAHNLYLADITRKNIEKGLKILGVSSVQKM